MKRFYYSWKTLRNLVIHCAWYGGLVIFWHFFWFLPSMFLTISYVFLGRISSNFDEITSTWKNLRSRENRIFLSLFIKNWQSFKDNISLSSFSHFQLLFLGTCDGVPGAYVRVCSRPPGAFWGVKWALGSLKWVFWGLKQFVAIWGYQTIRARGKL